MDSLDEKGFCEEEYSPYQYSSGQKIVGVIVTLVAIFLIVIALVTLFANIIENIVK